LRKHNEKLFWQIANNFGKFLPNFNFFVGEIERRIFRQTLCDGEFSFGKKSLLKSTLEDGSDVAICSISFTIIIWLWTIVVRMP
jgi:hypothetical protein